MEELTVTLFLSALLAFCLMFYIIVTQLRPQAKSKSIPNAKRVLLVTAHPDDETMFFGPTILGLTRDPKTYVHLLCLSMGNYRNQGLVRKYELYKACSLLGIPEEHITILRYAKLRDDPSIRWREELVSELIMHEVVANNFDVVVTFDRGGVSGHKNHTSIFNAIALLIMEKQLPTSTRIYCLRSVNIFRKYSFLFDLPMSFALAPIAYAASISDWLTIRKAMTMHQSQYVWFRQLYMIFSRYVLINTFDQVNPRASSQTN